MIDLAPDHSRVTVRCDLCLVAELSVAAPALCPELYREPYPDAALATETAMRLRAARWEWTPSDVPGGPALHFCPNCKRTVEAVACERSATP